MKEHYDDINALIAKQLAGETDAEEDRQLEAWLAEGEENRHYFQQITQIWEMSPELRPQFPETFDTEAALRKVKTQIAFSKKVQPTRMPKYWLQAAVAAAVAMLFVALWWLQPGEVAPVEIVSNTETMLTDTLTDGSVVTLNRNSGLSIAKGFNQKERRMALRGEAYFEVTPNKERPFVVAVGELEVKVVGTAFNVDNATTPGKVRIEVTHGKVLVSTNTEEQSIYLTAGELAEYDQQTHTITRLPNQQNPNALAYKNKVFRFDSTPLRDVVQQLNIAYGARISLQNKNLESCMLTARYNNLTIGRVLELIAASFSIQVEQQPDGTYLISGTGCGE